MYLLLLLLLGLICANVTAKVDCPCGWQMSGTANRYAYRLYDDFSKYPSAKNLVSSSKAKGFKEQWVINGFLLPSSDPASRDQQFNADSVSLSDGYLHLKQLAYSPADLATDKPIQIAGIQTKVLDILHGSFRTVFKITGATGGSVGSFFWYHNDSSEIDIEIVTDGNSIVNNTINYTEHPSLYPNGQRIPNATLSVPFTDYTNFHAHRFDCTPQTATYYLDGIYMHHDHHNVPHYPGSLQLNLWADGNKFWSGIPSATDATMSVQLIDIYFNTSETDDGSESDWFKHCNRAGGPTDDTICMEGQNTPIASASAAARSSASQTSSRDVTTTESGTIATPSSHGNGAKLGNNISRAASDRAQAPHGWLIGAIILLVVGFLSI